jgi:hypothetical protein
MSFTVADVIADVRDQIQDNSAPYRYDDIDLTRKVNQTIRRAVILRPDLFTEIATIACVAGGLQACPADSVRLMDVLSNSTGAALKEVNQEVLDLMIPEWESQEQGPATNWMRYPRDPNRFYVYPPASTSLPLQILYSKCPATLTSGSTVPMQDVYMPVMVDGVCWLAEAVDAEHVESGRAKMFKDSFTEALIGGLQTRRITDTESAGGPPEEAV